MGRRGLEHERERDEHRDHLGLAACTSVMVARVDIDLRQAYWIPTNLARSTCAELAGRARVPIVVQTWPHSAPRPPP